MATETVTEHQLPEVGKISPEIFEHVIKPRLGKRRPEVLVGPQHGIDVGIVEIGGGQVMALTTDPFFIVPEYGWRRAAWFAVHILASDASTSGLRPTYFAVDLNLPRSIRRDQLEEMWQAVDETCRDIGMAIVTGHTARYDGCNYPMVGGATVISVGEKSEYVTPAMARVGDAVVVTKGAAIEATGLFGVTFPDRIAAALGPETARAAEDLFYQMSVVKDALTAVEVGVRDEGVTAMHDATECGVWGGLYEVAEASGVGMTVDRSAVVVRPEVRAVCDLFGMDPYSSISEGTLILTCRLHRAGAVIERLRDAGIGAARVGEVTPAEQGIQVVENGREHELEHPRVDPFWNAFGQALAEAAT
ncbi:MAG: AIR synthase family protein [Chloroflexi bacterium]|nr:AIR synthase family protein [Chloroflexota bacterium]